jgi:diadenosine tetraphosphate (Ap4A) HIT family hydrolase
MDYKDLIIKQFDSWELYLHENQSYLGRCYLWYKKDEPIDMFDLDTKPLNELYNITNKIKKALTSSFQPDNYNYASLNNITRHLHFHIVPRYERPVTFNNHIFDDKNWGNNYSPYPKDCPLPVFTVERIIAIFKSELN